ncbi:DUF6083 domain-containing protein [Streptomyces sp. ASQP_92]|uniref:DUF6083 domain-containing protein n=1 Tax=Streptomyces sp. ASQP_92 TaxID=2979116 RepID=UPI0021C1D7D2|nr:DUF6083 domain-containing protein [Streptomyces sp. ASQP_92]MCT9094238.1 DUF6083 domain-containing protein [Streptomyces sp. ASQP_92]
MADENSVYVEYKDMAVGDGSGNWEQGRTMRVHRSSASKTLRAGATKRCIYCNHPIEWYERGDNRERLPLLLQSFPSHLLPERYRWSVFNGLVYFGEDGSYCRIAHPAVCSAIHHEYEKALDGLRRSYKVATATSIQKGEFVPAPLKEVCEDDVVEQVTQTSSNIRHVVRYNYVLLLAPCEVDQIQCVARASSTGERCKKTVCMEDVAEGLWVQVEIPPAPGRGGQETLMAGQLMWVYDMSGLDPQSFMRWKAQTCATHHDTSAPQAEMPEWVWFDTWRHGQFITYDEPEMAREARKRPASPFFVQVAARTGAKCAQCGQYSHTKQEAGWLCAKCAAIALRREQTHRKWQVQPQPQTPEARPTREDSPA